MSEPTNVVKLIDKEATFAAHAEMVQTARQIAKRRNRYRHDKHDDEWLEFEAQMMVTTWLWNGSEKPKPQGLMPLAEALALCREAARKYHIGEQ
jgi:hypothetical protein